MRTTISCWALLSALSMGCARFDDCAASASCVRTPDGGNTDLRDASPYAGDDMTASLRRTESGGSVTAEGGASGSTDASLLDSAITAPQSHGNDAGPGSVLDTSTPAPVPVCGETDCADASSHTLASLDAGATQGDGPTYGDASASFTDADESAPDDSTARSGSRLKLRRLTNGAGSGMALDFWDMDLDVSCSFREAVDGQVRCLPPAQHTEELRFSDAECGHPVYKAQFGCGLRFARDLDTEAFYEKTDAPAIMSGREYYRAAGECIDGGIGAEGDYFEVESFPVTNFVLGELVNEPRSGDLIARYIEGEDGSRFLYETRHATRGYVCSFDENAGYCLPPRSHIEIDFAYFENDQCTNPAYGLYVTEQPPPLLAVPVGAGCDRQWEYHERGTTLTASTLYRMDDEEGCVDATLNSSVNYFRPGPRRQPSDFPMAYVHHSGEGDLLARRWTDANGAPLQEVHEYLDLRNDETCTPTQGPDDRNYCLAKDFAIIPGWVFSSPDCDEDAQIAQAYCPTRSPAVAAAVSDGNCDLPIWRIDAAHETGETVGPDYYFQSWNVQCEHRTGSNNHYYSLGPEIFDELPMLSLEVIQ